MTSEAATRAPTTIHLVPHTHWDREWYRPFQSFRMQLVDLVDRVLDMLEADDDFTFTLDGQLATVDDYLEIRPEQEERLRGHVASGRLAIGPWLILMDEFLVSGETLVRNLEMGWARAHDFGEPMHVGYLPDMFGHVAQMPQILRRAGLADAVVWRGVPASIDRHGFRWESPDGSWVRAEYLPSGYGNAAGMFAVPDRLDAAATRFVEWSRPWFGDDPVLAMYGTDHTAPVPELAALVGRLNEVHEASHVKLSTLADYVAAATPLRDSDPCWRGEMRSGARANVLMGVASAHIDIKQAAGRAENLLERYAEPLSAIHLPAHAWPAPFLSLAWRRVVENSAHDSICGCSVDPVARQVLVRFAEAEQVAGTLSRRAAGGVATSVPAGALLALNPSPTPRTDLVEAELLVPDEWGEVALELHDGTRVATQELARKEPLLFDATIRGAEADDLFRRFHGREIFDHSWNGYRIDGRTVTLEVDSDPDPAWLDVDELRAEVMAALRSAPADEWQIRIVARSRRTLAAVMPAPALGWTAARAVEGAGDGDNAVQVAPDGRTLDNGLVAVTVDDDGTLRIRSTDGTEAVGVGRIVEGGDFGDSYNYGPPASDRLVEHPETVEVRADLGGPIRGRTVVTRSYAWPAGLTADGSERTSASVPTEVVMEVELRAGEPFVRIGIAFDNQSDDHRVRLHAPLPRPADASHAEGQFAVVERGMKGEGGYREEPLATYPAHGWVDAGGLGLLLTHLAEYELLEAPSAPSARELAVTLLRSTGLISRNDNPYREDPAGPELAIPAAQMRGRWRYELACLPHAGSWIEGDVPRAADRYRHPFVTAPGGGTRDATWPPAQAGLPLLEVQGDQVVLSALRRRDGAWLEARLVNLASDARTVTLTPGILEAREADLLGAAGEPLPVGDAGALELRLGPAEIRTIHLRREETALAGSDLLDAAGPRQNA
ncbi:MAG: alpha-mannosidase [Chloroflexi bacterium]|nr:alpha-mannosidase [Chloroflexota bacterium]